MIKTIATLIFLMAILLAPMQSQAASIYNKVPYTVQRISGSFYDPRFRDGCEETSVLMALSWINGNPLPAEYVREQVITMTTWENNEFGFHQDTSAADTARIMKEVYGQEVKLSYDVNVGHIHEALLRGSIVIIPVDGTKLGFYTRNVPPRHTIVVVGYDETLQQFIVHDPLIHGGNTRIASSKLNSALRDYPSGVHKAVTTYRTAMIEVGWPW
jgi:uncharacterized protein YvpB